MADSSIVLTELHRKSTSWAKVVDEIVRIEKKIFPKHESLARSFDDELKKKNSGLIYLEINGDLAGYVMYSCPSSLCAIITKLAGIIRNSHFFHYLPYVSESISIVFITYIDINMWICFA